MPSRNGSRQTCPNTATTVPVIVSERITLTISAADEAMLSSLARSEGGTRQDAMRDLLWRSRHELRERAWTDCLDRMGRSAQLNRRIAALENELAILKG